jgi:hypothetical protein
MDVESPEEGSETDPVAAWTLLPHCEPPCDLSLREEADVHLWPSHGAAALFQTQLLEQYKLAVEMADRTSLRRQMANGFFTTLLSALAVLFSILDKSEADPIRSAWPYVVPAIGVFLCLTWLLVIRSYRMINEAKYQVIVELEARLPAAVYASEWSKLSLHRHLELTTVERAVPALFLVAYALLAARALVPLWPG